MNQENLETDPHRLFEKINLEYEINVRFIVLMFLS